MTDLDFRDFFWRGLLCGLSIGTVIGFCAGAATGAILS